ncbi:hypothetical protein HHK36_028811 [Tetracentron sinense]|uniref:Histone deacetylase complex subunit SAP18 n=1 Tax=Tetracentron sinense TaxID=13715 RepID=A0A835D0T0_TETSI|nr:hypothetical protein HHK36_028811 [Tetracentron sinense]
MAEAQNRPGRPLPPHQARGFPPSSRPRFDPVDREKTCPLLLRVFTKGCMHDQMHAFLLVSGKSCALNCGLLLNFLQIGGHHTKEDFAVRGKEPKDEVQIYTWKDATLRELTDLVKEVASAARRRDAKLSFAFVYPDKNGRYVVRQVGMTHSYGNGRRLDDGKALAELSFQIGDYLDVAIL